MINERQTSEEDRASMMQMVKEIYYRTGRIETKLFGLPGQEYDGWIPRTDRRLDDLDDKQTGRVTKIENRVLLWIGAMSIIGPMAALVINFWLRIKP